MIRGIAIPLTR